MTDTPTTASSETPAKWVWDNGNWATVPGDLVSAEVLEVLLAQLPATSWNMLSDAFNKLNYDVSAAEDLVDIKKFFRRLILHPQFKKAFAESHEKRRTI